MVFSVGAGVSGGSGRDSVGVGDHIVEIANISTAMIGKLQSSLRQIDEVNRMTQIISMNARIESARIGSVGRGFAVIAQEMDGLSRRISDVTKDLDRLAGSSGEEMHKSLSVLESEMRKTRLCELALSNIDLIDRNLYERSCDVRWWSTDSAIVAAADVTRGEEEIVFASARMEEILDSYTVYFDLVLADSEGVVIANGRPDQYASVGLDVSKQTWFMSALHCNRVGEFGFQSVHSSELVCGERVLIYSCIVRKGGRAGGKPLGVLGIVFRWDALAQNVLRHTPLSSQEWACSRVCIVDDEGQVLADSCTEKQAQICDFPERKQLLKEPFAARLVAIDGRMHCVAHAASPGYETYRTGWHSLIMQAI